MKMLPRLLHGTAHVLGRWRAALKAQLLPPVHYFGAYGKSPAEPVGERSRTYQKMVRPVWLVWA